MQEFLDMYTLASPFLGTDELKNGFPSPKSFRGFRETGPRWFFHFMPMQSSTRAKLRRARVQCSSGDSFHFLYSMHVSNSNFFGGEILTFLSFHFYGVTVLTWHDV